MVEDKKVEEHDDEEEEMEEDGGKYWLHNHSVLSYISLTNIFAGP